MTNKEYWRIADAHELVSKNGNTYVPRYNCKSLVESIVKANKNSYYECLADLDLFNFRSEKTIKYCVELLDKLHKKIILKEMYEADQNKKFCQYVSTNIQKFNYAIFCEALNKVGKKRG